MGIVVDTVVAEISARLGRTYHWSEWEQCAADLGLLIGDVVGLEAPAYLLDGWIIFRSGMPPFVRAWYAWEEIGHHLTCAGNRDHWRRTLPGLQGELNVARFERLAHDVRTMLPSWEDHP